MLLVFVFSAVAAAASAQGGRGELRVAYGVSPVSSWIDAYSDKLSGAMGLSDLSLSDWGAVTAGYDLRLAGGLSVGIDGVYASSRQREHGSGVTIRNRYWSVMPSVRWRWLSLRVVSFYSHVGAGATFSKARAGDRSLRSTQLAFQVSPLGVEVGGRVAAFAEAGIGSSGCLLVGARYRF